MHTARLERTPSQKRRVVIIGGGFAGLRVAKGLSGAGAAITLVDRHNYHVFQPLLYQVATAVLSPGDIAAPLRRILRRQRDVTTVLAEARAIDTARRTVTLDGGDLLEYDYLVVATGATHAYFGHDEWRRTAPGLKTLDDALEIRRRVLLAFERAEREPDPDARKALLTFVVIGAGATGVEMAGALTALAKQALVGEYRSIGPEGARIILAEGGAHVLPTFPPDLRRLARNDLRDLGVEVRTDTLVTSIADGAVQLGDERVRAATVIWAAGVQASPIAKTLGVPLDKAGRVFVTEELTVPGHPDVFVLGDLATLKVNGQMLPGLAAVAQQQGDQTAANIRRAIRGRPLRPFRYRDRGTMATIGRWRGVAEIGDWQFDGALAWLVWLTVHLMKLVGFRNRLSVLLQWLWVLATADRSVRLITRDDLVWDPQAADAPRRGERRTAVRQAS
jgi:NADH dehydrogenase